MIDEDLLLNAARTLQAGRRLARADTVSIKVGTIADERGRAGMWEPFPHDLVELESVGKLEHAPTFAREGNRPPPKTLILYALPREQSPSAGGRAP